MISVVGGAVVLAVSAAVPLLVARATLSLLISLMRALGRRRAPETAALDLTTN